jgi:TRAP-type C4-dicarboxylate transport system substrate-binding protein
MRKLIAFVVIAGFAVACGQSAAEKQAEEIKAQAQKVAAAAEQVGKAAEASAKSSGDASQDLAKAMQGMAAAMSGSKDGKPIETVSIDVLKSALPSIAGYEMDTPKSERMTAPFPISQTEAKYKKGDSDIDVKIVDAAAAQLLMAPWKMMMATGYSKETDDGYEKATTIGGNPGWEKWDKSSKHGEVGMFVGNRFMVSIEGDNLANINQLHDVAAKIDASKLK